MADLMKLSKVANNLQPAEIIDLEVQKMGVNLVFGDFSKFLEIFRKKWQVSAM